MECLRGRRVDDPRDGLGFQRQRRARGRVQLEERPPAMCHTSWRAATSVARAPGSSTSETIRSFSSMLQRRRRSLPVMISTVPSNIDLNPDLKHRFKVIARVSSARRGPNNVDWHWWVKIGAALFDALADDGENLFITWSAQSPNDDREYTRRKWHSFRTSTMTTTTASLFWLARQNGWQPASERGDQKALRKETARYAFRMLRAGIPGTQLLARLHVENDQRSSPLSRDAVNDTALWAARQMKSSHHAT
jgi:hypothetical protein